MVNNYEEKLTKLQQKIMDLFFIYSGKSFNLHGIARRLDTSATAVLKAIKYLKEKRYLDVEKDKESNNLSIGLNLDNEKIIQMKRTWNLNRIYFSGIFDILIDKFPGATIILFGSYSKGEDLYTTNSDIDIAIIGYSEKEIKGISKPEKNFQRSINIEFIESFNAFHKADKHLKENLMNGIVLEGGFEL